MGVQTSSEAIFLSGWGYNRACLYPATIYSFGVALVSSSPNDLLKTGKTALQQSPPVDEDRRIISQLYGNKKTSLTFAPQG